MRQRGAKRVSKNCHSEEQSDEEPVCTCTKTSSCYCILNAKIYLTQYHLS